jgi:hypothetical protein
MAKNIAARRAAKAQRRKTIVAQKRRAEAFTNSPSGQVRIAASAPIRHCLVSEGLFGTGMGIMVLARGVTAEHVTMGTFLLDTFGLGVKDVFLRHLGRHEFELYLERMSSTSPMLPVEPADARKLLHDLTAWSRGFGFSPHPDYPKIELLFGSVDAASSDAQFAFGVGGKPLLTSFTGQEALGGFEIVDDDDDDLIDSDAGKSEGGGLLEDASEPAPHADAD